MFRVSKDIPLYERIYGLVRQIPVGKVATYGQIAREASYPRQPRMVGYALHALPNSSGVPWHRVINAQGKISFPRKSGSYNRQKRLLRKEGISFAREVVDLKRFGWLSEARKR